jgi:hypothetical protein
LKFTSLGFLEILKPGEKSLLKITALYIKTLQKRQGYFSRQKKFYFLSKSKFKSFCQRINLDKRMNSFGCIQSLKVVFRFEKKMIGFLFKELPPVSETKVPELAEELSFETASADSLIASLPLVQKIVSHKAGLFRHSETSDIVQGIVLRLLKWRKKHQSKSEEMSSNEWQSFAARTAYNEINRHYKSNPSLIELPLDSAAEVVSSNKLEGQSGAEIFSLAQQVWQETCNLSLRRRRALLFGSQELVVYFLKIGITDEELAEKLSLTMDEWESVKDRLPLMDIQIAEVLKEKGNQKSIEAIANSIKKARHEARLKVRRVTNR